jgi:hypothetical protein
MKLPFRFPMIAFAAATLVAGSIQNAYAQMSTALTTSSNTTGGETGKHPQTGWLLEPPAAFVPGRYFAQKASFYLKKKDHAVAVEMFQRAALWGNKIAQYNLGVMYFNGLGVPVDRPRGVAWFGIAAQKHGSLADLTLLQAWQSIDVDERAEASRITDELLPKYGDDVTVPRAKRRFVEDRNKATGSHLGVIGNLEVTQVGSGDGLTDTGTGYYRMRADEFEEMLGNTTGRVEIGAVMPIDLGE